MRLASRRFKLQKQRRRTVTAHSPDLGPNDRGGTGSRRSTLRRRLLAGVTIVALVSGAAVYAARSESVSPAPQASSSAVGVARTTTVAAIPSLADLVEKVRPAVVSVRVRTAITTYSSSGDGIPLERSPFEQMFRDLPAGPRPKRLVEAQGSGFLVSADGFIVTNNHLVDGGTMQVQAMMADGKVADARVVGRDPVTDIALLKVDAGSGLPFVTLADTKPRVGDWVIAIGNPFGLGSTVTAGIVSAMDRDIGSSPYGNGFIQIDAPINRGNSGGPTFNMRGQVIGINTAIYSPSGGSVGIAFDIPAATVNGVITQLRDHGGVDRGWLGVEIQPVTRDVADALGLTDAAGALVSGVQATSPAAGAGIVSGNVIVEVNGTPIKDARDLAHSIGEVRPGDTVKLTIRRNGKIEIVQVRLGRMPG
jgi:serine protease Do